MNLLRNFVLDKLSKNLSPALTYHGLHHTLDVVKNVLILAKLEGITKPQDLKILEAAAWFHDIGFITTAIGHEEESCRIAEDILPQFGFSTPEIDQIKGLIMATKIPQMPQNKLEMVLADADLDYLGRDDFDRISDSLFFELKESKVVQNRNDWNKIQVKFLSSHKYWTASAIKLRNTKKEERLQFLMTTTIF